MIHPSSIELEAFACGEPSPRVDEHLGTCDACRAFVDHARAATPRIAVEPLLAGARRTERRRRQLLVVSFLAPIAAAAAAILVLRAPTKPETAASTHISTDAPVAANEPASDPDTTFKGALQLAVVRERSGGQARFISTVRGKPGDRLRIEVALDRPQPIIGGVLGDDGTWLEVMPEGVRAPGTHFSEKSVRVDARPANGTILVGSPEDVRRARETRRMERVHTLRIEWEAP